MAHFSNSCLIFSDLLSALLNSMFTADIMKEDQDEIFSPTNLYLMPLIWHLEKDKKVGYLRYVYGDNLLVSMAYKTAKMLNFPTPKTDGMLKVLQFDARPKMVHYYKPSRRSSYDQDFLKIKIFIKILMIPRVIFTNLSIL